jgi:hypothetical protein
MNRLTLVSVFLAAIGCLLSVVISPSYAQNGSNGRVIHGVYFVGSDFQDLDPDWEAKMQTAMELLEDFYRDQLNLNGYGNKTFRMERGPDGRPIVHFVRGRSPSDVYGGTTGTWHRIKSELRVPFRLNVNAVAVMTPGAPSLGGGSLGLTNDWLSHTGRNRQEQLEIFCDSTLELDSEYGWQTRGQRASLHLGGFGHELGHVFGLAHSEVDTDIMSAGFWGFGRHFVDCNALTWRDATTLEPAYARALKNNRFFVAGGPPPGPGDQEPEAGDPDLVVQFTSLTVRPGGNRRRPHLRSRARVQVCNRGDAPSPATTVALYSASVNADEPHARPHATTRVKKLNPGRCRRLNLNSRTPNADALPLGYWVAVDPNATVDESNEDNNLSPVRIIRE